MSQEIQVDDLKDDSAFVKLSYVHCPLTYYREIRDTVQQTQKSQRQRAKEMKLILNWRLQAEAKMLEEGITRDPNVKDDFLNKKRTKRPRSEDYIE